MERTTHRVGVLGKVTGVWHMFAFFLQEDGGVLGRCAAGHAQLGARARLYTYGLSNIHLTSFYYCSRRLERDSQKVK